MLLLERGTYSFRSSITVPNGTVLRGEGVGETTLLVNTTEAFLTIGSAAPRVNSTAVANITDSYVAVGASTFDVDDAFALSVGQPIMVQRAVTASWVRAMGMADLVRNGKPQTWIKVLYFLFFFFLLILP